MDDLAGLFGRMLLIGLAVAAPVGAMGVLTIQRTVARGWGAGMSTGLGIATADAAFAAVAAFGITLIADALASLQVPLRLVGGAGLLWLGWRALRSPAVTVTPAEAPADSALRDYGSAVGLTLTNPVTIIAFAAIFAGAGLVAQPGALEAGVAVAGVAVGSLLWWVALTSVVAGVRHALHPRALLWINRASGLILLVFGTLAIMAGVAAWRG